MAAEVVFVTAFMQRYRRVFTIYTECIIRVLFIANHALISTSRHGHSARGIRLSSCLYYSYRSFISLCTATATAMHYLICPSFGYGL